MDLWKRLRSMAALPVEFGDGMEKMRQAACREILFGVLTDSIRNQSHVFTTAEQEATPPDKKEIHCRLSDDLAHKMDPRLPLQYK